MSTRNAALKDVQLPHSFAFHLPAKERTYRVPFSIPLQPRNPAVGRARSVARIEGAEGENARIVFADGGRRTTLGSLAYDYRLDSYVVEGDGLPAEPTPKGQREATTPEASTPEWDAEAQAEEEPRGVAIVRVDTVLGWPLHVIEVVHGVDEALIDDEELGRRLGYAQPDDVRQIILRIWGHPSDPGFPLRRGKTPSSARGGRPRTPFLLTERQACKVCMRSETALADAIQDEIIEVFLAVRHGRAAPPAAGLDVIGILDALKGAVIAKGELEAVRAESARALDLARRACDAVTAQAGGLDAAARAAGPGEAVKTPDGTFVKAPPADYLSQRGVARKYALPTEGAGSKLVGAVARAMGIPDDPEAAVRGPVVSCGLPTDGSHLRYGPKAIATMDASLRRAHRCMLAHGYAATHGSLRPLGGDTQDGKRRSAVYVAARMLEAALSDPADTSH